MKHTIYHIWQFVAVPAALAVAAVMTACSLDREEVPVGKRVPLTLEVAIEGANVTAANSTRARKYPTHDLWSNYAFAIGDELGFFSQTGGGDDGNEPIENLKLTAQSEVVSDDGSKSYGAKFRSEEGVNIDTDKLTAENVHFYFPYDKNITDTGLELRVQYEEKGDGIQRCIDFLVDDYVYPDGLKDGDLSGIIKHAFGELIITRGTGFDQPGIKAEDYDEDTKKDYEKITVVMRTPVTHVKINCTPTPWSWKLELTNDKDYDLEKCDGNDARRWQAWQGAVYGRTIDENGKETSPGKDAWYVILPTLKGQPSIVDYIEIYDNEGKLQKVSVLRLDGKDDSNSNPDRDHQDRDGNYVWASWRYPMEIAMKELVPTVNPYPILSWDQENNDITNERARGIDNAGDFAKWAEIYANYVVSNRSNAYEEDLKSYGDLEVDGENAVWHFYISANIDFGTSVNATISKLEDILDGQSSTLEGYAFSNNTLTNITKTFVGELSDKGELRNIDFKSPTVKVTDNRTQAGIIANEIKGGTVYNCNINSGGLIGSTNTAVGIVAGSIDGGTVENCTLSGLVIGASSDKDSGYMFGSKSGTITLKNNNSSNVTFSDIKQTDEDD